MKLSNDYKGTISEGTLNSLDLAHKLNILLLDIDAERIPEIGFRAPLIKNPTEFRSMNEAEVDELVSSQFDFLNEIAPENCYFGAHPGDGADFGYWEYEE